MEESRVCSCIRSMASENEEKTRDTPGTPLELAQRVLSPMDWWASLEYKIRYKKDVDVPDDLLMELKECA